MFTRDELKTYLKMVILIVTILIAFFFFMMGMQWLMRQDTLSRPGYVSAEMYREIMSQAEGNKQNAESLQKVLDELEKKVDDFQAEVKAFDEEKAEFEKNKRKACSKRA